jgi:hypothetical protein
MEWSRLSILVDAIPIEEPKGAIAGLLDFGDNQSGTQGVNGTRRNEDAIPRLRAEDVQAFFGAALLDRGLQIRTPDSRFEAGIEDRISLRFNDIPSFGLSPIRSGHLQTIGIVWMDLNAEYSLAIEILKKKWESLVRRILSENLFGESFD